MARIRTVKPELFTSETVARVSVTTERTFVGLLTAVDDAGRMRDQAAVLNGALWPTRPEHTVADMEEDLAALAEVGLLCRYQVDGRRFLHVPSFREHQVINRPSKPRTPGCPTCPPERGGVLPAPGGDVGRQGPGHGHGAGHGGGRGPGRGEPGGTGDLFGDADVAGLSSESPGSSASMGQHDGRGGYGAGPDSDGGRSGDLSQGQRVLVPGPRSSSSPAAAPTPVPVGRAGSSEVAGPVRLKVIVGGGGSSAAGRMEEDDMGLYDAVVDPFTAPPGTTSLRARQDRRPQTSAPVVDGSSALEVRCDLDAEPVLDVDVVGMAHPVPDPAANHAVEQVVDTPDAQAAPVARADGEPAASARPRKGKGKTKGTQEVLVAEDARALCEALADRVRECMRLYVGEGMVARVKVTDAWLVEAERLLRTDGVPYADALSFIEWATQDEFWRTNIRSMPSVRSRYPSLVMDRRFLAWSAARGRGVGPAGQVPAAPPAYRGRHADRAVDAIVGGGHWSEEF